MAEVKWDRTTVDFLHFQLFPQGATVLTGKQVKLAVVPRGTRPATADWRAVNTEQVDTQWWCKVLVGPGVTTGIATDAGGKRTYDCWRMYDADTPVIDPERIGTLVLT